MAATVETGMTRGEMKKMFHRAKEEAVSCAVGVGENASLGLLLMHKTKSPKATETTLKGDFPDVKNSRFGTAFIDMEDNPKRVRITLNRAVSGIARRLIKTLKGTGYNKVIILLEDGSVAEEHEEEDEDYVPDEDDVEAPAAAAAAANAPKPPEAPAVAAAPPPPPPPLATVTPQDKAAQVAALAKLLAGLASQIPGVAGDDAARKATLLKLATDANVHLKTGNLVYAANSLDQLKRALSGGAAQAAPAQTPTPPAEPAGTTSATLQELMASRQQWTSTQEKVRAEVDKLAAELSKTYQGESFAAEITSTFRSKTATVIEKFDDQLLDVLDDLMNTSDPALRGALVGKARGLIKTYLGFAMSDPFIGELDANPFVKLAIRPAVTGTLAGLAKTLH